MGMVIYPPYPKPICEKNPINGANIIGKKNFNFQGIPAFLFSKAIIKKYIKNDKVKIVPIVPMK